MSACQGGARVGMCPRSVYIPVGTEALRTTQNNPIAQPCYRFKPHAFAAACATRAGSRSP